LEKRKKKKTTSQTKKKQKNKRKSLNFHIRKEEFDGKKAFSVLGCTCTCAQDNFSSVIKKILK
jgi:hypothetical protein